MISAAVHGYSGYFLDEELEKPLSSPPKSSSMAGHQVAPQVQLMELQDEL